MIRVLLLVGASTLAVSAHELVVRDLRLALGTGETSFDWDISGNTVDARGTGSFDNALSLDLGGRWSFSRPGDAFGLVVGADVGWELLGFGSGSLQTLRARGTAGLGWALTDFWIITGELGLLYGRSTWEVPATISAQRYTADGDGIGYDLRIDTTWRIGRRIGVGGFLGWQVMEHEVQDQGVTSVIDRSGWIAGVLVFWRFSNAPPRLQ